MDHLARRRRRCCAPTSNALGVGMGELALAEIGEQMLEAREQALRRWSRSSARAPAGLVSGEVGRAHRIDEGARREAQLLALRRRRAPAIASTDGSIWSEIERDSSGGSGRTPDAPPCGAAKALVARRAIEAYSRRRHAARRQAVLPKVSLAPPVACVRRAHRRRATAARDRGSRGCSAGSMRRRQAMLEQHLLRRGRPRRVQCCSSSSARRTGCQLAIDPSAISRPPVRSAFAANAACDGASRRYSACADNGEPSERSDHVRRFLPHQAPAALRLRRSERDEGGGARGGRGHHRSRHGQSRRAAAAARHREAGRSRAQARRARLFRVEGHSGAAQGAGQLLRPPLRRRARSRERGRRDAGLEGGPRQSRAGDHRAGRRRARAQPELSDPHLRLHHRRRHDPLGADHART